MNYGQEFINLSNKKLTSAKKELINIIINDYDSNEFAEDLVKKYNNFLIKKIEESKIKDNLGDCESSLIDKAINLINTKKYKSKITETIINKNVLDC